MTGIVMAQSLELKRDGGRWISNQLPGQVMRPPAAAHAQRRYETRAVVPLREKNAGKIRPLESSAAAVLSTSGAVRPWSMIFPLTSLLLGLMIERPVPTLRLRSLPPRRMLAPECNLSVDDPRVLTVAIDRVTGIDFGCDITLRWVYVLGLTPNGAAERTGLINLSDQLVAVAGGSVIGLPIGEVMDRLGTAEGETVDLTFFRGEREELQAIMGADGSTSTTITITVERPGTPDVELVVPYGANLRDELIARKINVYQSITR